MKTSARATMKAVIVHSHGTSPKTLKFDMDAVRPACGPGMLLVRNEWAGVNFIDTYQRTGLYPVQVPFIPGREAAGVVEEVGSGLKNWRVGDRVAYLAPATYAQYSLTDPSKTHKLQSNMSTKQAAATLLQALTACYLLTETVQAASGGTGGMIVQMAKKIGAKVIGLTSTEAKAKIATKHGANHVIVNYHTPKEAAKIPEMVAKITGNEGVRVVYDGVGGPSLFVYLMDSLAMRGFYVNYGNAAGLLPPIKPLDMTPKLAYFCRPSLVGYIAREEDFRRLCERAFSMIFGDAPDSGPFDARIWREYELEDAWMAHRDIESGETSGKLLLRIPE